MAVVIRADGKEKVTGVGRYAADLTATGLLHGRFKFAGIGHDRPQRPGQVQPQADVAAQAAVQQLGHAADQSRQVDRLRAQRALAQASPPAG